MSTPTMTEQSNFVGANRSSLLSRLFRRSAVSGSPIVHVRKFVSTTHAHEGAQ